MGESNQTQMSNVLFYCKILTRMFTLKKNQSIAVFSAKQYTFPGETRYVPKPDLINFLQAQKYITSATNSRVKSRLQIEPECC